MWDRAPGFESQLHCRSQLPADLHLGRQRGVMFRVAGSLPPLWETQIEFLAPGFACCGRLGSEPERMGDLCLSRSCSLLFKFKIVHGKGKLNVEFRVYFGTKLFEIHASLFQVFIHSLIWKAE